MKYLVIGLGNLGRAIAKDLTRVGNEVIGVDMDLHRVDMLKNDIAGYGRCDRVDYTGEYKDRDWVWHLEPGELFDASYTIEIAGA